MGMKQVMPERAEVAGQLVSGLGDGGAEGRRRLVVAHRPGVVTAFAFAYSVP